MPPANGSTMKRRISSTTIHLKMSISTPLTWPQKGDTDVLDWIKEVEPNWSWIGRIIHHPTGLQPALRRQVEQGGTAVTASAQADVVFDAEVHGHAGGEAEGEKEAPQDYQLARALDLLRGIALFSANAGKTPQ